MSDYTNMSIQALFDSFDTHVKNGEIDKKEEKTAKKLYGGIFTVTKGMDINSFKAANADVLVDKNLYLTLYKKIENDSKEYQGVTPYTEEEKGFHIGNAVRRAAYYFGFIKGQQLTFDDLKSYIDKSDRMEQLQNAFKILDILDNYDKENGKINFTRKQDGYFNTQAIDQATDPLFMSIFSAKKGSDILKKEVVEQWINALNINCTIEDIETILFALHFKSKDCRLGETQQ